MSSRRLYLLSVSESGLTPNDSITIADLTNSLKDYAVYHLLRSTRRGGGLPVITRKGLHVSRNEGCIFSTFKHFDQTIASGNKIFHLVTVYLPLPSKKNGFTVERFPSEFSAFLEELTVTSCQFLLCGDLNFHVDDNSNANAKQFSDLFFSADLKHHVNGPTYRLRHTLDLLITREIDSNLSYKNFTRFPL